jgi:hypothetical protein
MLEVIVGSLGGNNDSQSNILVFLRRRQTRWRIDHQEGPRTAYMRYETAWATAWPHLDDWFKAEARLSQWGRIGPVIV